MRIAQSEHQTKVEQQLFDVHAHLDIKRAELEFVQRRVSIARVDVEAAGSRVALAETAQAQLEFNAARDRFRVLNRRLEEASLEVDQLVDSQDTLLAKLVS